VDVLSSAYRHGIDAEDTLHAIRNAPVDPVMAKYATLLEERR